MTARKHLELLPAQSGCYVLVQSTNTWLPIVGWRLSFNPDDPECEHPITMPVVWGGWSPDDGYVVKSPGGQIGYVHGFEIAWTQPGTEQERIGECKTALQHAVFAAGEDELEA